MTDSLECPRDGSCLKECECTCYDPETQEMLEACVCGHRTHSDGYCPSICCSPLECRNFKFCQVKVPQKQLVSDTNLCSICSFQMGTHQYNTKDTNECCVCLDIKPMLTLKCQHQICNDCWYHISARALYFDTKLLCPLCRQSVA